MLLHTRPTTEGENPNVRPSHVLRAMEENIRWDKGLRSAGLGQGPLNLMARLGLPEQGKCYCANRALPAFQPLCRSITTPLQKDRVISGGVCCS